MNTTFEQILNNVEEMPFVLSAWGVNALNNSQGGNNKHRIQEAAARRSCCTSLPATKH